MTETASETRQLSFVELYAAYSVGAMAILGTLPEETRVALAEGSTDKASENIRKVLGDLIGADQVDAFIAQYVNSRVT